MADKKKKKQEKQQPPSPDDSTRDADWPKRTPDRMRDLKQSGSERGKSDA